MGRKISEEILAKLRQSYERGIPLQDIAEQYAVCRQTISSKARKYGWRPSKARGHSSYLRNDAKEKSKRRNDDVQDRRLIDGHAAEWQVVRTLLQAAIDHRDADRTRLARDYADALSTIQSAERLLRSYRSQGRLRTQALRLPNVSVRGIRNQSSFDISTPPEGFRPIDLHELFQKWQNESDHLANSTIQQWHRVFDELIAFLGHADALRVNRNDVLRWKDELIARSLSPSTIRGSYIGGPRAVFNFGVGNLLVPENPFARVRLPKPVSPRRRSKSFSDEEARTILTASLLIEPYGFHPHVHRLRRWATWLAAFSGARIGELCQLRKQDIGVEDGIHFFHITPTAGPIKTKKDRRIPLHPQIVQLGFIEEVNSLPEGYLFGPEGGGRPAADKAKNVGVWVRSLGITDRGVHPNHGWRHRFKTICRQAGIPFEYHNAITGHANDHGVGNAYGEFPLGALHRELTKLPWVRVKISDTSTGARK
jgi:integrase